jgi:hypothetical protein
MEIDAAMRELEAKEKNIRFSRLLSICTSVFGSPRISGSHHIFKMPWQGHPQANLQAQKGKAKPYQVRQVLECLKKYKEQHDKT